MLVIAVGDIGVQHVARTAARCLNACLDLSDQGAWVRGQVKAVEPTLRHAVEASNLVDEAIHDEGGSSDHCWQLYPTQAHSICKGVHGAVVRDVSVCTDHSLSWYRLMLRCTKWKYDTRLEVLTDLSSTAMGKIK